MLCLAILAHDDEIALANQLSNIARFVPGARVVVFNGGPNPEFARSLDVPICPLSHPLERGRLARFLIDTMCWLEDVGADYDFLVSMDSDVVFVREGFEEFLHGQMAAADAMGINMAVQTHPAEVPHWYPGQTLWREWDRWQPFFRTEGFCGTLNAMQVYRHPIVSRIVHDLDRERLRGLLETTQVFAMEEMLAATLAYRAHARIRAYPWEAVRYVKLGAPLTADDIIEAAQTGDVYFVHPVVVTVATKQLAFLGRATPRTPSPSFRSQDARGPNALVVSWGCYQGGVETALYYRLRSAMALGASPHAYFFQGGAGLDAYATIPHYVSADGEDLVRYVRAHPFDAVTSINMLEPLQTLAASGYQGPLVYEFHGFGGSMMRDLQAINESREHRRVRAVIVPSYAVASIAHGALWRRPDVGIHILHNLIDTDQFARKDPKAFVARHGLTLWEGHPLLGWVGRLDANKNWALLLEIFRMARASHDALRLLIVSDLTQSPDLHEFFQSVAAHGLLEHVRVLSNLPHDEMPDYYSVLAASQGLLLSTSYTEGYPYHLLEAQACECPVLCSNAGGSLEIVAHGVTGYVFPIVCSQAGASVEVVTNGVAGHMFRYLERLLQDSPLRSHLTVAGRDKVLTVNDATRRGEEWLQLLRDIVGRGS